ncbi:MAG: TonB-dependent receptor [Sideroxydans sp.]|jgi:iron complex outermembrane receptor protein
MMNTQSSFTPKLFLLSFIAIAPVAAWAEDDGKQLSLDEVVVTATRTGVTASDAPAAVTVVKASDIQNKNASRLGDALDQVPSLYLRGGALGQSQGTSGTSSMSLRGVDQSRVLILIDGQPVQDSRAGKVNWQVPFMDDIARIEVVPGAFSSLYGSNAIGGVINIITKQPTTLELTAKVKKGWGDASGEDASVYIRNKLDNGLGFAAGVGYQNRDSYVNDFVVKTCPPAPASCAPGPTLVNGAIPVSTREGAVAYLVGNKGTTPWNSANATVKLFYDLNDRDKIYTGFLYQKTDQGYTRFNTYLTDAASPFSPISSGNLNINGQRVVLAESNFVNNSPLHEAATRLFVGYDGTLGKDYGLKLELAQIKREYSFTFAGSAATWNGGSGSLYDTPNSGLDGTAQLIFPVGARQVLVTGVALHNDIANQQIYTLANWRDPEKKSNVTGSYNGDSTTTSIFVQDEISAAEALTVYLGGRLDKWETKGDSTVAPAVTTRYSTRSATAFSPKASAVYRATEFATLRASFGRSFRAPTNEDMYTTTVLGTTTYKGDPNLQPERGSTWEIGGELKVTESTKINATYYETRLNDMIYSQQTAIAGTKLKINAGRASIRGVELAAASGLTYWLKLDANYAYIDSRILENVADPLSVGKRLTDAPRNIIGIGITASHDDWTGSLNARYVSHIFWNAQNTDVVEGVPGSYDAHTMVNAKIAYAFTKVVKGSVAINNLLDTKAYSYFLLPRRNLTAELDLSF